MLMEEQGFSIVCAVVERISRIREEKIVGGEQGND